MAKADYRDIIMVAGTTPTRGKAPRTGAGATCVAIGRAAATA